MTCSLPPPWSDLKVSNVSLVKTYTYISDIFVPDQSRSFQSLAAVHHSERKTQKIIKDTIFTLLFKNSITIHIIHKEKTNETMFNELGAKKVSLLAEVSHGEAFLPRRERPLLAGKKKVSSTACHSGISTSPKKIFDEHWLQFFCNLNSPKKLHLPIGQVKNRNH